MEALGLSGNLIILFISLLFSAFFSGMEIAFYTANELKIQVDRKQGNISAKIISRFIKHEKRFIATLLLGNNAMLVIYGLCFAQLLEPALSPYIESEGLNVLVITILSTLIILITAEFLPKSIFRKSPNWFLSAAAIPLLLIYYILYIPMLITVGLSDLFLKMFKIDTKQKTKVLGRIDLQDYLGRVTELAEQRQEELDHEIHIFQNALEFGQVKARDCMVHRTKLIAMEVDDNIENLRQQFIETGLSKILVYRDNIDNIIGYVHSYELFKHPSSIKSILLPVSIIPETITANNILKLLIRQNRSIAVVVDEFGGTAGIVTTEDVMEEIFGEIEDEHDAEILHDQQLNDNTFSFSGRIEIDFINDKYKLSLPVSEDYETIAGLILEHSESIPQLHDVILINSFSFTITEVSDNRIDRVELLVNSVD